MSRTLLEDKWRQMEAYGFDSPSAVFRRIEAAERKRTPFVAWLVLPVAAFLAFCVGYTISAVVLLFTVY